jgi:hypothetical protein
MTRAEIATLENAGRAAVAWAPESYDGDIHFDYVLKAIAPAIGILAVAATLLLAVL